MNLRTARLALLTSCTVLLASSVVRAAPPGPRDPDWPCQQIKVPDLSLAAVWSGPTVDPQQSNWKDDPDVVDLVHHIAPRAEPVDQVQGSIHTFAKHAGNQKKAKLLDVLVGTFSMLGDERLSVMGGLDRVGKRQKELAEQIRSDNEMLQNMQAETASDPQVVQRLTQQVTWEVEVFQDRRKALSYACEVPGKIEQRWFALARQIQQELK
jgi:hypothetical protein